MTDHDHDEAVRESFGRQVGLFTGDSSPFARRAPSPTSWVEPLDEAMIVLDVACGAGHVAEQVAPLVRQVVGVDLTPALLDAGAERLARAGVGNVLLQTGNATVLPFVDGSFDLVVCRGALHHIPDPRRAVAEMARVCRPGGRVVVADMVAPSPSVRDRFNEVHRFLDPSHAGCLLEQELADLLEAEVGPLSYAETPDPLRLPVEHIFTDVADRDAVRAALRAELDGGPATGLDAALDDDGQVVVSFVTAVLHAARPAA